MSVEHHISVPTALGVLLLHFHNNGISSQVLVSLNKTCYPQDRKKEWEIKKKEKKAAILTKQKPDSQRDSVLHIQQGNITKLHQYFMKQSWTSVDPVQGTQPPLPCASYHLSTETYLLQKEKY